MSCTVIAQKVTIEANIAWTAGALLDGGFPALTRLCLPSAPILLAGEHWDARDLRMLSVECQARDIELEV